MTASLASFTSTRREREKSERRNTILDAAMHLFTEQGVEATTMEMVAARAEIAKGTLYLYFASKDELTVGLLERQCTQMLDVLTDVVNTTTLLPEGIGAFAKCLLTFYEQSPTNFRYLMRDPGSHLSDPLATRVITQRNQVLALLEKMLARGQQTGELRPDVSVRRVARFLWAHYIGLLTLHEAGEGDDLLTEAIANRALIMRGILA